MRFRLNNKGFTIIELMIVVMIIGILTTIAIPNYFRFAKRAKEAVVLENMHMVHVAMEEYSVSQLGVYPQPADEPVLKSFLPQNSYPDNPFTNLETVVAWNADPGLAGEMSISNLPGGGYRLRGHGADVLLQDIVAGD